MRRCVFCDKEIWNRDPPEHVIPKWMRKLRPPGTWFFTSPPVTLQGESTNSTPASPGGFSKGPEIKTYVVCKACNEGWLARLESRAALLLPPMIGGIEQPLTIDEQAFLSVWAIKTTMMWQTVPPNERLIGLEDYRYLREHLVPPSGFTVRIGCYDGDGITLPWSFCVPAILRDNGRPQPDTSDTHRTVLAFGKLVFETVSPMSTGEPVVRFPDATGHFLLDIWPGAIADVRWPPPFCFDNAEMLRFMDIAPGTKLPHPAGSTT